MIWNKNRQCFVELYNVTSFAGTTIKARSWDEDFAVNDISGKVLTASYYEEQDLVMFYENDTKLTGICGEIWNLLAYHLNFTLKPLKYNERNFGERLDNGSYSGLMGLLDRNETQVILRTGYYSFRANLFDYTTPIWNTWFRVYIQPEFVYDNKWIVSVFTRESWYVIIFLFLTLSLAGYILQNGRYGNYKKKRKLKLMKTRGHFTLRDHFFYTYSMMCGQGYLPGSFHSQNRILSFSKSIFSWLIILTFSSNLIYRMTNRTMMPPFTSLETLLNKTKYNILVFKGAIIYELMKNAIENSYRSYELSQRVHFVDDPNTMYEEVCQEKRIFAMLENQDKAATRSKDFCPIVPVGTNYYETWVGFAVPKHFPYKRIIDISITRLREFGLINHLKSRWLKTNIDKDEKSPFKMIDIDQDSTDFCFMRELLLFVIIHDLLRPVQSVNGVIWNRKIEDFVPIFSVPAFADVNQERLSQSRKDETHNFQGKIVRFNYYEQMNLVNSEENGTRISGVIGEIWNLLSEFSNFTLIPIHSTENTLGHTNPNGTHTGLLGVVQRNETDAVPRVEAHIHRLIAAQFSLPLWKTKRVEVF
ncbi:Glutamate receptor ionotropic, kainate glr-3 [Anthophora retusa]